MINFQKYQAEGEDLNAKINAMWLKLGQLSLAEIVNFEIESADLVRAYDSLDDRFNAVSSKFNKEINQLTDEEWDEIEDQQTQVDNFFMELSRKLRNVERVVSLIEKAQSDFYEREVSSIFGDIQTLELEKIPIQRFLK